MGHACRERRCHARGDTRGEEGGAGTLLVDFIGTRFYERKHREEARGVKAAIAAVIEVTIVTKEDITIISVSPKLEEATDNVKSPMHIVGMHAHAAAHRHSHPTSTGCVTARAVGARPWPRPQRRSRGARGGMHPKERKEVPEEGAAEEDRRGRELSYSNQILELDICSNDKNACYAPERKIDNPFLWV